MGILNKTTDISKENSKNNCWSRSFVRSHGTKSSQKVVRRLEVAVNTNIWLHGYMIAPVKYADV